MSKLKSLLAVYQWYISFRFITDRSAFYLLSADKFILCPASMCTTN